MSEIYSSLNLALIRISHQNYNLLFATAIKRNRPPHRNFHSKPGNISNQIKPETKAWPGSKDERDVSKFKTRIRYGEINFRRSRCKRGTQRDVFE